MEIFKIGDEIAVTGYKAITLSDDMQANINNFAEINGIEKSEAEKILAAVPGLHNFISNLASQDVEEDYEITGDFVDDTIPAKVAANKTKGLKDTKKDIVLDKTSNNNSGIQDLESKISNWRNDIATINSELNEISEQNSILKAQLDNLIQSGDNNNIYVIQQQINTQNAFAELRKIVKSQLESQIAFAQEQLEVLKNHPNNAEIQNIVTQKLNVYTQFIALAPDKQVAMQNEDEFAQSTIEQKENNFHAQLKTLEINLQKEIAKTEGRTFSTTEISLLTTYLDNEFKLQRIEERQLYLDYKLAGITSQKSQAMQNEDEYAQYVLEQQENSINALDKIIEMDKTFEARNNEIIKNLLDLLKKYPNNTTIQQLATQKFEVLQQRIDIATEKSKAYQNDDEYTQYVLEQQENGINAQLKTLEVNLQKEIAKLEGRTLSDADIESLSFDTVNSAELVLTSYMQDVDFRLQRIQEKRQYLSYKAINIVSQKSEAIQHEDEYAQEILEQQTNSINALDKVFEMDEKNIQNQKDTAERLLNIVQKYPNNTAIQQIVMEYMKAEHTFMDIANRKSYAIQLEDENALNILHQEEDAANNALKTFEVNLQKEIAKAEGKTLSSFEISKIENDFDKDMLNSKIEDSKHYLEYMLIGLTTKKSEAINKNDDYAVAVLEEQITTINNKLSQINSLSTITDVEAGLKTIDDIMLGKAQYEKSSEVGSIDHLRNLLNLDSNHNEIWNIEYDAQGHITSFLTRKIDPNRPEAISNTTMQYSIEYNANGIEVREKNVIPFSYTKVTSYDNNGNILRTSSEEPQPTTPVAEDEPEVQEIKTVTPTATVASTTQIDEVDKTASSSDNIVRAAKTTRSDGGINDNTVKDLLGIFNLPVNTIIDSEIKDGNKLIGFVKDNVKYIVIFDETGAIKEARTTDMNNQILSRHAFPADPLEEYRLQVECAKNELLAEILPYIVGANSEFLNYDTQKVIDMLTECINDYKNGVQVSSFHLDFLDRLARRYNFDIYGLRNLLKSGSSIGNQILDKFNALLSTIDSGLDEERKAAQWETVTQTVNGVHFRIKYLKELGSNPCQITVSNGKILISGDNCIVDVMSLGNLGESLQINGEDITVNCNAGTFDEITNNAKGNTTINGSFGDDRITNNGSGATINAGDGDDEITNNGANVRINGDKGNDTIINYGNNTTVNGGDGDDVVNRADNVNTTIIPSSGDDKENVIHVETPPPPVIPPIPGDPDYPYAKEFTVEEAGVTLVIYSKTDDFSGISVDSYKHLVRVTGSDIKIKVKSKTYNDTSIRLQGDKLNFLSDVSISVFNYANNSTIKGSNSDDELYNYADNVNVLGLDGKDKLINEGSHVTLDGGEKEDHVYNRQGDGTVSVNVDGSDKMLGTTNAASNVNISKGSMSDKDYNLTVTFAYLEKTINDTNYSISSTVSSSVMNNIQSLIATLIRYCVNNTTGESHPEYSETANKLIQYEYNKSTANTGKTQFELLKLALQELDANVDGDITPAELTAFVAQIDAQNQTGGSNTPADPIITANLPDLSDATVESLSTSLKASVGLTDAQMTAFINSLGTNTPALKTLKQIQTIINMCSSSSTSLLENIKTMITNDTFNFNNEILEDAQLVLDALNSGNYDEYIKSHMILDATSLSDSQILSQTHAGDVVKKADGKLYVNDSGTLTQLNISEDTYITLFPPISRYFVEQNDYEDCFFLATTIIEGMENDATRAKILQMFSENSSGDISVKFPYIDYPVTFTGGQLKATDGIWSQVENGTTKTYNWNDYNRESTPATTQAKGLSMLEQAYALAKFAELSNANISYDAITEYYSEPLAAAIDDANITDTSTLDMDKALLFYYKGGFDHNVYEDLYGSTTAEHKSFGTDRTTNESILQSAYNNSLNSKGVMTTRILGDVPDDILLQYNLGGGHQYAIESIDTGNKIVYVKNPWESYMVSAVPYNVFFQYFSDIFFRTI